MSIEIGYKRYQNALVQVDISPGLLVCRMDDHGLQVHSKQHDEHKVIIPMLTPHSLRAALITTMAEAGATHETLMVQGRWRSHAIPRKYMRGTGKLATHALRRVARRLRPLQNASSDLSDGEDELVRARNGGAQRSCSNSPDDASVSSDRHTDSESDGDVLYFVHKGAGFKPTFKIHVQQCEVPGRCKPKLEDICRRYDCVGMSGLLPSYSPMDDVGNGCQLSDPCASVI
eukprot:5153113-Amphidinium_carterae.2